MAMGVHPIDLDRFSEACAKYLNRECTQAEAAEIAGISIPTFKKYLWMMLSGEELPDTLFKKCL